jgi:hypothetical protein
MVSVADLLPGDIVVSRENSLASRFIRWATNSPWSHVSIVTFEGKLIGAVPPAGVCIRPLSVLTDYEVYRFILATPDMVDYVLRWCESKIGDGYDFKQVVLVGYRLLIGKLATYKGDPNPHAYMCSEFVAEAWGSVGWHMAPILDNMLPGDFVKLPASTVRRVL